MKLEQQVVSLELAQKLKELGVKQESLYYWATFDVDEEAPAEIIDAYTRKAKSWFIGENCYSAFTVAELGEKIRKQEKYGMPIYDTYHKQWYSGYWDDECNEQANYWIDISADTEADARAKMLVYLLENNLITL